VRYVKTDNSIISGTIECCNTDDEAVSPVKISLSSIDVDTDDDKAVAVKVSLEPCPNNLIHLNEVANKPPEATNTPQGSLLLWSFFSNGLTIKKKAFPICFEVASYIQASQFKLPRLNREKWGSWPNKKPSKMEIERIKQTYPRHTNGSLNDDETAFLKKRLKKLCRALELGNDSEHYLHLLNEIRSLPDKKAGIFKVIFAAYVGGKRLLKTRLAVFIWKKLVKMITSYDKNDAANLDNTLDSESLEVTVKLECKSEVVQFSHQIVNLCSFFKLMKPMIIDCSKNPLIHKLYRIMESQDFKLPPLNVEKWPKWPSKMPTKVHREDILTKKYPDANFKVLNKDERDHLLKRLDAVVSAIGLDLAKGGRSHLINELLSIKERSLFRIKLIFAGYIAGPEMLQHRLAVDVWLRLVRLVQSLNRSKLEISQKDLSETIKKCPTSAKKYTNLRSDLGYSPSQIDSTALRNMFVDNEEMKVATMNGPFDTESNTTLIYIVFKSLNITNINDYDPKTMEIPWMEISKEFDRKPSYVRKRWLRMYPLIMRFENKEVVTEDYFDLKIKTMKCILANPTIQSANSIDYHQLQRKVKYWNIEAMKKFLSNLLKYYEEEVSSFRENLVAELYRLQNLTYKAKSRSANYIREILEYYAQNIRK
jgi:hypothetical protein